ncbi:MAG: acetyl-CoA hydrolase-like protein [Frankiales bacterium]|nr:acetyl-CoA hydrolase-like protein [Frankiales bacterium]
MVTREQLAAQLQPHAAGTPRVVAAGNFGTPLPLLSVVDAVLPAYRLFVLNAQGGLPDREGVEHETPFVGPGVRHSSRLSYLPARLSLVPRLFAGDYSPDIVLLHTTMPRGGRVSLGIEVNILPAAIEQARRTGGLVIAQVNPQMPWTFGDAEIPVDQVDLGLEADEPLPTPMARTVGDVESEIGERVAGLVPDGATLQLGIGGVPDAALRALTKRRGLRIWSEMFSDGVLALDAAGAVAPAEQLVASFLFGSAELYDWVNGNPRVRILRTEVTNDPGQIAQRPRMTAINSALQVDLFGQANASWVGNRVYSGFGGQTDFVVGALHAKEGLAVLALPSWHPKADCSTIVPVLEGPVTSFQHSWVVTEQGSAMVWPAPAQQQARHLIDIAHPDAQPLLAAAARARGILAAEA